MFSTSSSRVLLRCRLRSFNEFVGLKRCRNYNTASNHTKDGRFSSAILPATCILSGLVLYHYNFGVPASAEAPPEQLRKIQLSSQHDQVLQFWDRPGVYAWGSNSGNVAAPDLKDEFIKAPRRISFFDGYVLRDLKFNRDIGAAVTDGGDLYLWGSAYSSEDKNPEVVLKGKDIQKVELSQDKIVAMSKSGKVYSLPFSKHDQANFPKPVEQWSSWTSLWSGRSNVSYRLIQPNLGATEKVIDIAIGQEHGLLLTSSGRVFSFVSSATSFPEKGQMGIPGLTWSNRPEGSFDMTHEIVELKGLQISQIAAGDYHSVVVDRNGRVHSFGDNTNGQLGVEYSFDFSPIPALLPTRSFYRNEVLSKCVQIAAGGLNSYFVMETREISDATGRSQRPSYDVFSCGNGVFGMLGTGKWSSAQSRPQKIIPLSGLFEYSDREKQVVPIRISYFTVGATHAAVVLSNIANVKATKSDNDINFGADALFFGGNEFYQLGTGKRNNLSVPSYIPPMDPVSDVSLGKREEHRLQVVPSMKVRILDQNGSHRTVNIEQRLVAGRGVSGCYTMVV